MDSAYFIAQNLGYEEGIAMSHRNYGSYFQFKGDYDKGVANLKKGLAIFERVKNPKGSISCINGLANIAWARGDYSLALEEYIKTVEYNRRIDNPSGEAKGFHNIGNVFQRIQQPEKALNYYNQALQIKKNLSDTSGMVLTLNAICGLNINTGKYHEALEIGHTALSLAVKFTDKHEQGNIINNIGIIHYYLNDLDSTKIYYERALSIYTLVENKSSMASGSFNLGTLELSNGNANEALLYFNRSLDLSKEINDPYAMLLSYEGLSETYSMLNLHKEAHEAHKSFYEMKDSLEGIKVKSKINELDELYQSEIKDRELSELKISKENSDREKKLYYVILVITIIAVAISITAATFYFKNQKTKSALTKHELEQKALRSQMNPHFIFNCLNSIQRLYLEGDHEKANDYLADFSRLLRSILVNSGLKTISLMEEVKVSTMYLELEQMRTDNFFNYTLELEEELKSDANIYVAPLILQPYLENAIWHGILPGNRKGEISIKIERQNEKQLLCTIKDNGVGINVSQQNKQNELSLSRGMQITEERLGGSSKVSVRPLMSGGTKIELIIDYYSV